MLGAARLGHANGIGAVFVIPMENHNWTQPGGGSPAQLFHNAAAPFINSLVTPGNPNAAMVSYAVNYLNAGPGVHPSEPNYVWSEAGTTFGLLNDNDPFPSNVHNTSDHLCGYLQALGVGWRSYQEDTDLAKNGNGQLTNMPLDPSQYTVPLVSFSGTSPAYTNEYNGTHQYAYGAKHNPMVFFLDTDGGNNQSSSNPEAVYYAPLQQLQQDLNNNTVARYNWITPDLYNDMHTALSGGFHYNGTSWTGDQAAVAQGDNFLSIIVPEIMASQAFQNNGVIVIWTDETEGGDSSNYTLMEIVISPLAKGNGYAGSVRYTHSSDLLTWQEVFAVGPGMGIGDAQNANDLSDMFLPGTVPSLAQVADPTSCTVVWGSLISGSLSDLFQFDSAYMRFQPGYVPVASLPPAEVVLDSTSPFGTVSDLRFDCVHHVDEIGVSEKIELYDWTAGSYVQLSSGNAPTSDVPIEVEAINPNRFIQPGTNAMRARLSCRPLKALPFYPFNVYLNQAIWKVVP